MELILGVIIFLLAVLNGIFNDTVKRVVSACWILLVRRFRWMFPKKVTDFFGVAVAGETFVDAGANILKAPDPAAILQDGEPNLLMALRWDGGLVSKLYGRDAALNAIVAWAKDQIDKRVAVRLISGPGGAGKTRLAAEAARRLIAEKWRAAIVPRADSSDEVLAAIKDARKPGLFLIVDYPEERIGMVDAVLAAVAELPAQPVPVRLVLVSRKGYEDWRRYGDLLGGRFGRQAVAAPGALATEDALALLRDAATSFAKLTGKPSPNLAGAEAWLEAKENRRLPLIATAAGIEAVLDPARAFRLEDRDLMLEIAQREMQRVRRISRTEGLGEDGLARLLALACLNGSGLNANAVQELGDLDVVPGMAGQALLDCVRKTPWWIDADGTAHLARLEPDRPAAAFVHLALFAGGASPALPDWIFVAIAGSGKELGATLSRVGYDLSALPSGLDAFDTALAGMIRRKPERAQALYFLAFGRGTVFLAGLAAEIAQALLKETPEPEGRGLLLNSLSANLSQLGQREAALKANQEAVQRYRELVSSDREAFNPHLARSLINLAGNLSNLGRRDAALKAIDETVQLYRELVRTRPKAFTPELAMSLNNLSNALSGVGQREAALDAIQEAVELRRVLARTDPEAFTPDLAGSLNNLSNRLSDLGQREAALDAIQEALALRRKLARSCPEAFTPNLALSLNNLSNRLSGLGQREAALGALEEAVELRRDLARSHPERFTPDLAGSLNNLSNRLSDVGQREAALEAIQEAVRLLGPFFLNHPQAFAPLMGAMRRDYLRECESTGTEPDRELLAPIDAKLAELEGGAEAAG